ncbi:ankyrin [Penicillium brevicompactum]|uniref:Ankyrin n=1 Tax=Penicillium brevicompactum TaxID=5074 RepID=A0A9W9QB21_PENBR|nr:ankyrin [Penicillium brevicompactum]
MASIVVEHLFNTRARYRRRKVGIAYWYCTPQPKTQNIVKVFGSILIQLIPKTLKLPQSMTDMFQEYSDRERYPSPTRIMEALCDVARAYDQVFIVIDGIDEISGRHHSQHEMLDKIFTLQERTQRVRFFATSRPLPEINARFDEKNCFRIEIQAHQRDVALYVKTRLRQMPNFVRKNEKLQSEVMKKITKDSGGISSSLANAGMPLNRFLLVELRLNALALTTSALMFRRKLRRFKDGPEEYELLYENTMRRITHKDGLRGEALDVARSAISWVLWSRRELTIHELQHAIAVTPGRHAIETHRLSDGNSIISLCGGLLQMGTASENVEFVHSTARKYFEKTSSRWFPWATDSILKTCLIYLSFPVLKGVCKNRIQLENRLKTHPLYAYAAQNWGHHARECSGNFAEDIKVFLACEDRIDACSQVMMLLSSNITDLYSSRRMRAPHLVAYFGLFQIAKSMALNRHVHINSPDADGRTPFLWVARNGHARAVKTFLQMRRVLPNLRDKDGRTAFSWAAGKGHTAVLERLLVNENIEVYHQDAQGWNALTRAVMNDRKEVFQLLLKKCQFDVNSQDQEGRTALWWAAAKGRSTMLQQLLPGCDKKTVNQKDNNGWDALTRAWQRSHPVVVGNEEQERHYREGIYGCTWEKKIDANTMCVGKRTALSWAAGMGFEEIVRELLDRSPEAILLDSDQGARHPLSWAAAGGRESVVKLLLERRGINLNQPDAKGRTPLWWAIANNKLAVVRLLAETPGVCFNEKDHEEQTPLSLSAGLGHSEIVELLLSHRERLGIDVNSTDKHCWTPILMAARSGKLQVVRQLLRVIDVNPDATDKLKRTPLMWAIIKGHAQVAQTLILGETGIARLDLVDIKDRSALFWAAWAGDAATIELLSGRQGVKCNERDRSGESPLSIAIKRGYSRTASDLLHHYKDIDLNAEYENGLIPLHLAAQRDDGDTTRELLEKGADLNRCDHFGRTPLFLACGIKDRNLDAVECQKSALMITRA